MTAPDDLDQAEVDRRFRALEPGLPGEREAWRRGGLDLLAVDLLRRTPAGRLPAWAPAAGLAAAVAFAALHLPEFPPADNAAVIDAVRRHRDALGGRLAVRDVDAPLAVWGVIAPPGSRLRALLVPRAAGPSCWLLAEIDRPDRETPAAVAPPPGSPWRHAAERALRQLRDAI